MIHPLLPVSMDESIDGLICVVNINICLMRDRCGGDKNV